MVGQQSGNGGVRRATQPPVHDVQDACVRHGHGMQVDDLRQGGMNTCSGLTDWFAQRPANAAVASLVMCLPCALQSVHHAMCFTVHAAHHTDCATQPIHVP